MFPGALQECRQECLRQLRPAAPAAAHRESRLERTGCGTSFTGLALLLLPSADDTHQLTHITPLGFKLCVCVCFNELLL